MQATVAVDTNVFGTFSVVSLTCHEQARVPAHVALVLDVSGSMEPNMDAVVGTALASVDILKDGDTLSVVIFDTLCDVVLPPVVLGDNRRAIKEQLKAGIVNIGGSTNLEAALKEAFSTTTVRMSIMLVTDGEANCGLAGSEALIKFARENYGHCVVHTLGLQLNLLSSAINTELLNDLATDTNGTKRIASRPEDIGAFVGDVIAEHEMMCFENVIVDVSDAVLLTPNAVKGFTVRSDRPTHLIYKHTAAPPVVVASVRGTMRHDGTLVSMPAVGSSLLPVSVLPTYVAHVLKNEQDIDIDQLRILGEFSLIEQIEAVRAGLSRSSDDVVGQSVLYDMTRPKDSNHVSQCRNMTQQILSQYSNPKDDSQMF